MQLTTPDLKRLSLDRKKWLFLVVTLLVASQVQVAAFSSDPAHLLLSSDNSGSPLSGPKEIYLTLNETALGDSDIQKEQSIYLGGVQFAFPFGYLAQREPDLFSIITQWPRLPARRDGPIPKADLIEILVTTRTGYETYDGLEGWRTKGTFGPPEQFARLHLLAFSASGIGQYYRALDLRETTPSGKPLAFLCDWRIVDVPESDQRCEANYHYRGPLWLTYRFKRKHLSSWREIDTAVRHLLDSHMVEK
jgi:hypothetical protein